MTLKLRYHIFWNVVACKWVCGSWHFQVTLVLLQVATTHHLQHWYPCTRLCGVSCTTCFAGEPLSALRHRLLLWLWVLCYRVLWKPVWPNYRAVSLSEWCDWSAMRLLPQPLCWGYSAWLWGWDNFLSLHPPLLFLKPMIRIPLHFFFFYCQSCMMAVLAVSHMDCGGSVQHLERLHWNHVQPTLKARHREHVMRHLVAGRSQICSIAHLIHS